MSNEFVKYLSQTAKEINKQLNKTTEKRTEYSNQISDITGDLSKLFADRCDGGKRIRGSLIKLGVELMGTKVTKDICDISVAFEVFQTGILIHDDIIDKSDTRRNKKTIHTLYKNKDRGLGNAICLGDYGFFIAYDIIANSSYDPGIKNKLIKFFSKVTIDTTLGEMLDVEFALSDKKATNKDIITISELKTARYSISGPLCLGAIIAGKEFDELDSLIQFGQNLGIAYQIQDDILGVFGSKSKTGKSLCSDIQEAKQTLLINYAKNNSNDEQKQVLENIYGKSNITQNELESIQKVFKDTGALNYSKNQAQNYCDTAISMIDEITDDPKYKSILKDMASYLINREK